MLKAPPLISSDLHFLVIKCHRRTYDDKIGPKYFDLGQREKKNLIAPLTNKDYSTVKNTGIFRLYKTFFATSLTINWKVRERVSALSA